MALVTYNVRGIRSLKFLGRSQKNKGGGNQWDIAENFLLGALSAPKILFSALTML